MMILLFSFCSWTPYSIDVKKLEGLHSHAGRPFSVPRSAIRWGKVKPREDHVFSLFLIYFVPCRGRGSRCMHCRSLQHGRNSGRGSLKEDRDIDSMLILAMQDRPARLFATSILLYLSPLSNINPWVPDAPRLILALPVTVDFAYSLKSRPTPGQASEMTWLAFPPCVWIKQCAGWLLSQLYDFEYFEPALLSWDDITHVSLYLTSSTVLRSPSIRSHHSVMFLVIWSWFNSYIRLGVCSTARHAASTLL